MNSKSSSSFVSIARPLAVLWATLSAVANIATAQDVTPPLLVSAKGEHLGSEVIVEFNEPLDRSSAESVTA